MAHPPFVRSLLNSSLVMPSSTLEASPANINMDLFCAFQPNSGNGAVIAVGVETARDSGIFLLLGQRGKIVSESVICHVLHKAFAKRGDRNAQGDISILQLGHKVRLRQGAVCRCIYASGDRKQVVHAAISSTVSVVDERASSAGPAEVRNGGIVLVAPSRLAIPICGFCAGLLPPMAGCE